MWELNSGSPVCSKCCSPRSSRPSIQPSFGFGQWSVWRITRAPYASAIVRTCRAPAMEPRIDAWSPDTGIALPATNAAPLVENWMITGLFSLPAVSITAFIEFEPMQLAAGMANCSAFAIGEQLGDGIAGEDAGGEVVSGIGHVAKCRRAWPTASEPRRSRELVAHAAVFDEITRSGLSTMRLRMGQMVTTDVVDGVATITLDSQPNRNTLSRQLLTELHAGIDIAEAEARPGDRAAPRGPGLLCRRRPQGARRMRPPIPGRSSTRSND